MAIRDSDSCERCGHVFIPDQFEWPWCPHGAVGSSTYFQDDIPGGLLVENLGPHPIRVYSHSERRRLAKEQGLEEFVRHAPLPGHDRSQFTTDWSRGCVDARTLENATILVSRQNKAVNVPEPPDYVGRGDGTAVKLDPGRVYKGVLDPNE